MSTSPASKTTAIEAALLSSLALMRTPTKTSSTQRRKPPPVSSHIAVSPPSTPKVRTSHRTATPATPRQPTIPSTPPAPRKRARPSINLFQTSPPPKRTRPTPATPPTTPSKPPRGRRKKALTFDRVVCIPMAVLRAQKDDPSALLRPQPRRSDELRRSVKMRIEWELEKARKGGDSIVDSIIGPREGKVGAKKKQGC
ncbi:hypothetical protein EKO04_008090 [Ascochyta lentis]|uniref:Uncharacterized protein n=1 Tax=Ascochyta lentis TaxID=205686 RepID=A0A8H7IZT0_9PLEO|nr:hypothetical protein EKO04_008090 [Ascochyta lentis]